jgi:hypothetical protein
MSKKELIIILLAISWPVDNLHRLLNAHKECPGNWYPFAPKYIEDLQWYVHDVCQSLSYLCIFIAIQLYITSFLRKDADINLIFRSLLIVQVVDLFHYLGWHRTSEIMITLEGAIFLYTALKIVIKHHKNGQTR